MVTLKGGTNNGDQITADVGEVLGNFARSRSGYRPAGNFPGLYFCDSIWAGGFDRPSASIDHANLNTSRKVLMPKT